MPRGGKNQFVKVKHGINDGALLNIYNLEIILQKKVGENLKISSVFFLPLRNLVGRIFYLESIVGRIFTEVGGFFQMLFKKLL